METLTTPQKLKPDHNKYDNIWEIAQSYGKHALKYIDWNSEPRGQIAELAKPIIFLSTGEDFVKALFKLDIIKLPIWKVLIPTPENPCEGAIYYIAETEDFTYVFRGTYGYYGSGPHQSAIVEVAIADLKLPVELRGGDYLLTLIGLRW